MVEVEPLHSSRLPNHRWNSRPAASLQLQFASSTSMTSVFQNRWRLRRWEDDLENGHPLEGMEGHVGAVDPASMNLIGPAVRRLETLTSKPEIQV